MPSPALTFTCEQTTAEPGLQQPAPDVCPDIIRDVVEQDLLDCLRLVDDEGPPPQQFARKNILLVSLGREGRDRAVAHGAQELPQTHALLRRPRRRQRGSAALVHDGHHASLSRPTGGPNSVLRSMRENRRCAELSKSVAPGR